MTTRRHAFSDALLDEGIAGDLQSFRAIEKEALKEIESILKDSNELSSCPKRRMAAVLNRLATVIKKLS